MNETKEIMEKSGPGHKITLVEEDYERLAVLAGYGMKRNQIANVMRISLATLNRLVDRDSRVSEILAGAADEINAMVMGKALKKCLEDEDSRMIQYWLNCQARWNPAKVVEVEHKVTLKDMILSAGREEAKQIEADLVDDVEDTEFKEVDD